jgi:peptidylprolyl isomerase
MKTVEVGNNVKIHYTGTLLDGTEFDNSRVRGTPLGFLVGESQLLPAFESAVVGMSEGETKKISLAPDEAYGNHVPEAKQVVPKQAFGPGFQFNVGQAIQGTGPAGTFIATILEHTEQDVTLDMNHPLAGKDLNFEIEVVEIED